MGRAAAYSCTACHSSLDGFSVEHKSLSERDIAMFHGTWSRYSWEAGGWAAGVRYSSPSLMIAAAIETSVYTHVYGVRSYLSTPTHYDHTDTSDVSLTITSGLIKR